MNLYRDVFERKEVKYHLNRQQHRALLAKLQEHLMPDEYGTTTVVSRYFDTPDRALIEHSLDKPLYKEKLRVRSYGIPKENDQVFVELKKKYAGIVYKRRMSCSYAAARAYLGGMPYPQACQTYPLSDALLAHASLSPHSMQISHEIDAFIKRTQPLRASMLIECSRTAWIPKTPATATALPAAASASPPAAAALPAAASASQAAATTSPAAAAASQAAATTSPPAAAASQTFAHTSTYIASEYEFQAPSVEAHDAPELDMRITFDENISYCDLFAEKYATPPAGAQEKLPLLPDGEVIMEIKSSHPFPLWLVHALDECNAYPSSFSKYGEAYRLCTTTAREREADTSSPNGLVSSPDRVTSASDRVTSAPDGLVPAPDSLVPAPDSLMPAPDSLMPAPDGLVPAPDNSPARKELRKPYGSEQRHAQNTLLIAS